MPNTYSQIYLQLVFAIRHRERAIPKDHKGSTSPVCGKKAGKLLAVHCMPDHAHPFVGFRPVISISEFIKQIKVETTELINSKKWHRGKFSWQEGYGVFSYSHSHIDRVIKYINNQEAHQVKSFKDEYHAFLETFEVPYEERYLFEFFD